MNTIRKLYATNMIRSLYTTNTIGKLCATNTIGKLYATNSIRKLYATHARAAHLVEVVDGVRVVAEQRVHVADGGQRRRVLRTQDQRLTVELERLRVFPATKVSAKVSTSCNQVRVLCPACTKKVGHTSEGNYFCEGPVGKDSQIAQHHMQVHGFRMKRHQHRTGNNRGLSRQRTTRHEERNRKGFLPFTR